jgi:hypothetical protein
MTTNEYLLNVALLVWILWSNLGTHRLTPRRVLLPMAIAAVVGGSYLRGTPTGGNDLALELVGLGAGVALGIVAALLVRVRRTTEGVLTTAGAPFALLWIVVIGGRMLFAYGSDHWFGDAIVRFSLDHRITAAGAWTAAFVLMALAMIVTRVAITGVAAARARSELALAA